MEIERGTRVGLNKRLRNYYFQGENGINLRADIEDTAVIPEEISDVNLEIIRRSVAKGHLIVGGPVETKPEVRWVEDDSSILEKGVKKMVPFLEEIAKTPGKAERSPVARLEKLLKLEKEGKNRKTTISKIEEILDGMGGISSIEEEEREEVTIKIA